MGPFIVEKQNEEPSLRCLAAMRQIYSDAKILFAIQIVLTNIVVVLLSFVNVFHDIQWILSSYCVVVAVSDAVFIDEYISSKKEKAAIIQEMFDTSVLDIEWNDFIEKIDQEIIFRYSEKYKKTASSFDSLKNWYSTGIKNIVDDKVKLICQYSNCRYDLSLRNFTKIYYSVHVAISSLLVAVFALSKDVTFKNIFILILLPLLPIIVFYIQRIKENNRSIKDLNKLKKVSSEAWDKVISGKDINIPKTTRQLQNKIFKNRKDNPLIFDWFYKLHRKSLENEMNYSVEQLVAQYNESSK